MTQRAQDDGMAAVTAYAEAKSATDVDGALRWCHPEWVLETVPYGLTATGHRDTSVQLEAFFDTFPDYRVTTDGMIASGDTVSSWGRVSATMSGPLLDIAATGRRYDVPYSCVFTIRDGLIARERFWFDLHDQCMQLGLSTEEVGEKLAAVRNLLAADVPA